MIDDQLSPEEQELVQQIQAASMPRLDTAARERIRHQMIGEFRAVAPTGQPRPSSASPHLPIGTKAILMTAAAVVVVVGLIVVQSINPNTRDSAGTFTITAPPGSQVAVVSSETVTSAAESQTPAATFTPVSSLLSETASPVSPTTPPTTQSNTPDTQPAPTSTQEKVVAIEGPVTSIDGNVVTIYGFAIEVEPKNPILQVIDVGDVVRVQGVMDNGGAVVANTISNIPGTTTASGGSATVGLDGPVDAIDGNEIVVNGIPVQLAPDDPLLQTIQVGDFVSVQGNFETSDSTIVLVVVNIVIMNTTVVQDTCWYHVDAMGMGHWHCDGMGMGMGDAMGMGDDGMGDAMGMEAQ